MKAHVVPLPLVPATWMMFSLFKSETYLCFLASMFDGQERYESDFVARPFEP